MYSTVKKITTKLSTISMTKTTQGNWMLPCSSFCSSSTVDTMNVNVETRTMDRERTAMH